MNNSKKIFVFVLFSHIKKNHNMKNIFFMLFFLSSITLINAQETILISGEVLEKSSGVPVEYATVAIFNKDTKQTINGVTTDLNGAFNIIVEDLDIYIEVSFIGLETISIVDFDPSNNKIDLGQIFLSTNTEMLDEIVVRGEKSQTVFKLDKRVFNVGKDLSSTGASAMEVLNNVPSVNVNIEGQISLRGSQGVQILINGKPSVLANGESNALGSITADMIEKVEVITNPSAKYDAEGTAGIINIVIKKSEKRGLNGSITLNTGVPNNHSIGLSLNRRTERFNLFSQIAYGMRTFKGERESSSWDKINDTRLLANGEGDKNEEFFNLILGTDFHINELNVLTLSGHYAFENEDEDSKQKYTLSNDVNQNLDIWDRDEITTATNPKWEYEFQYKKDFKDNKDRNLLFSALGSSFSKDKNSNFKNTTIEGNALEYEQRAHTNFKQAEYTFKLDYVHPISKKYTLETGAQYVFDDVSNDYSVSNLINTD